MTGQAERIKEQHRGARRAEPASTSRMAALDTFGLRYVRIDDFNVIVEGDYQLNLAMSFWRANDGSAQGYLVSTLDAEIRRQGNSEKLAPGRESGAAFLKTPTDPVVALAESGASPQSSSLLPVVSP